MRIFALFYFFSGLVVFGQVVELDRKNQEMEGWTVRVDERLLAGGEFHEDFGEQALAVLGASLVRIAVLVPEPQLSELRKVSIVMDEHPKLKAAQYHPSEQWLEENGYESSLAKCVHISQASFFANPKLVFQQPSVVLHELAHAYHDQVLSWEYAPVMEAFQAAVAEGQYETVLHISGREAPHYALSNHKEYFAEATEAWFGCNDFYPFVRPELKKHDGKLYEVIKSIWGAPKE
ncbi:MAG: metallopeptidase [Roseibacillus sp.]